ncbi:Hypothetical protein D9617_53g017680 [Elsinoe fawcettii]|nr:Hypothetical protein D9617_53g017680 [Elsinoe fawcettii]
MVMYNTHVRATILEDETGSWIERLYLGSREGYMGGENIDMHSKAREGKRLRVRLGTLEYRHVATFIGRLFVGLRFGEGFLEDMAKEEVEEAEMKNEEENVGGRGDISEFGKAGGVTSGTMM